MVTSNHARFFVLARVGILVLILTLAAFPVAAQTPTPPAWPTPIATENYIIKQEVSYGEGGVILGLLFLSGIMLLDIGLNLSERVTDR